MKSNKSVLIIKPLLVLLSFSLLLVLLFILNSPSNANQPPSFNPLTPLSDPNPSLKIRPIYTSYDQYISHQLNKTLNPKLRHLWATRDWSRKIAVFSSFFSDLRSSGLLTNSSSALCIGARLGQEVFALRSIGISNSIGIDLVPSPPLVLKGDFHAQPFHDDSFDFEFSNVFDHALYPENFISEIERTLKLDGVCVLHVALDRRGDKYSANDLLSVDGVVALFQFSELVRVRKVDGFGLDTEVVMRKKKRKMAISRKLNNRRGVEEGRSKGTCSTNNANLVVLYTLVVDAR